MMGILQEIDAGIVSVFEMPAVSALIIVGVLIAFRRTIRRGLTNNSGEV